MPAAKFSPELQDQLIGLLTIGNYRNTACALVGINLNTLAEWIAEGRADPEGKYGGLPEAIEKAEAGIEGVLLNRIYKASEKQWQAGAWILERKFPKRWARRDKTEVTGPSGGPLPVVASVEVREALDSATIEELEVFKRVRDRAREAAAGVDESGDDGSGG